MCPKITRITFEGCPSSHRPAAQHNTIQNCESLTSEEPCPASTPAMGLSSLIILAGAGSAMAHTSNVEVPANLPTRALGPVSDPAAQPASSSPAIIPSASNSPCPSPKVLVRDWSEGRMKST